MAREKRYGLAWLAAQAKSGCGFLIKTVQTGAAMSNNFTT